MSVVFTQAGQYELVVDGPGGACGEFQLYGRLHGPTAGVEPKTDQGLGLQIAPNPMMPRAAIVGTFRRVADGQAQLTTTDVQGRRVLRRDVPLRWGRVAWEWHRRDMNGSRVRPGIYLVELHYGEEALRSRVVVRN